MMITLTLTEAEAARICYALEAEAAGYSSRIYDERQNGELSIASGHRELLNEQGRDECLGVVRRIEAAVED